MFCQQSDLHAESDVEQKVAWPLLTTAAPGGLREENIEVVVLDAMGVIYRAGDDVAELLVPFVQTHGTVCDVSEIERQYTLASRGSISAQVLWERLGVDPALEDAYLAQHALMDGLRDLLLVLTRRGFRLACLSNDVSEWSIKLRRKFELETQIQTWVISGDVGARKAVVLASWKKGGEPRFRALRTGGHLRAAAWEPVSATEIFGGQLARRR
jgi:hypothetical protein